MKRDRVQVALQELAEAGRHPRLPASVALIRRSLADRSNHVVSRAARAAREADLASLAHDLVAAFPRFLEDPIRRDPGCVGDRDPGVLAEAFAGLLTLAADDAVPFVVERLVSRDRDVARGAAIALGEARRPDAVVALRDRLSEEDRSDVRHAIMLALAASRDDAALDALLELARRGSPADSKTAVETLRLYAHDDALQRPVQAALDGRRPARRRPRGGSA